MWKTHDHSLIVIRRGKYLSYQNIRNNHFLSPNPTVQLFHEYFLIFPFLFIPHLVLASIIYHLNNWYTFLINNNISVFTVFLSIQPLRHCQDGLSHMLVSKIQGLNYIWVVVKVFMVWFFSKSAMLLSALSFAIHDSIILKI